MWDFYNQLTSLGWSPRTILDIGGYKGHWTRAIRMHFPTAAISVVEPNAHPDLQSLGVPVYRELLSSTVKDVPWYSNLTTGDSMFQERTKHYARVTPVIRRTTTLDRLFPTQRFEFVKIDCQGAELDILAGGQTMLQGTDVLLLECPFAGQYNTGAPSFADYIRVVDALGFAPLELPELHRANGILCQVDILFLRKTSPYWDTIQQRLSS